MMETFAGELPVTRDNSSADVVLSNDDLLIKILLRLPVLSLLIFKSISKRWLSLINSPYVTLCRKQNPNIDPPCGVFLMHKLEPIEYHCVRFDKAGQSPLPTVFPFYDRKDVNVEILHSCNGLLLCYIRPYKLYVYNPTTNQFKLLPQCPYSKSSITRYKMAFEPTKSPHYKVICLDATYYHIGSYFQVNTYSSETCNWTCCGERFPYAECFFEFHNGLYWNDAIHWLHKKNGDLHYQLDIHRFVLENIPNPLPLDKPIGKVLYDKNLFESRGCLLFSYIYYGSYISSQELIVYEMKNGDSVWSLKYLVDLNNIMMRFPKTWKSPRHLIWFHVKSIVMGEREEDSFIVMEEFQKVIVYKVMLNTLHKIFDFNSPFLEHQNFIPFIPSLAGP